MLLRRHINLELPFPPSCTSACLDPCFSVCLISITTKRIIQHPPSTSYPRAKDPSLDTENRNPQEQQPHKRHLMDSSLYILQKQHIIVPIILPITNFLIVIPMAHWVFGKSRSSPSTYSCISTNFTLPPYNIISYQTLRIIPDTLPLHRIPKPLITHLRM